MSRVTRRMFLAGAGAACVPSARLGAENSEIEPLPFTGVNLAGAEFGDLLGVHGTEYLYPDLENARYYARLGFNLIRLPFKWERLEPNLGGGFDADEERRLTTLVSALTADGLYVVIDPHNYAKRRLRSDDWSRDYMIGSREVPQQAFASLWRGLAERFKDNTHVMLGLMNEPADITIEDWLQAANAATRAIRDAGASNLILVPGVDYTGAHSWISSGNTRMAELQDPLGHFAFEVHQYFDRDSSGTSDRAQSATIGAERIGAFQDWARTHGYKAFLGEFNGGRNDTGLAALDGICREMARNPDVWLGWAAWAGGPRWPEDDMFNLEPTNTHDPRPQTRVLARYAQRAPVLTRNP